MTLKQYYSRTNNAHKKVTSSTRDGANARKEMLRLTGLKKYSNIKFAKRLGRGKTYTKKEVRKDLIRVEKKKKAKLTRRHININTIIASIGLTVMTVHIIMTWVFFRTLLQ